MQELQTMLQQTREDLQKLPLPVSKDPVLELMHLIGDFSDDLHRHAEGFSRNVAGNSAEAMDQGNQFEAITKAHEEFWRTIRATVPDFRPFDKPKSVESAPPTLPGPHEYYQESISEVAETAYGFEPERQISHLLEPGFLLSEEAANLPSSQAPIYLDDIVERVQKCVNDPSFLAQRAYLNLQSYDTRASRILSFPCCARLDFLFH
jgi:hypothetical protein